MDSPPEAALLAAISAEESALFDVVDKLGPEDFSNAAAGLIYRVLRDNVLGGLPVDAASVAGALGDAEAISEAGGAEYVRRVLAVENSPASAGHYADLIRASARRRRIARLSRQLADAAARGEELGKLAEGLAQAISDLTEGQGRFVAGISEAACEVVERMEARLRGESEPDVLPTGFIDLDAILHGFRPGQLVIIGGRPGMGKTAFGLELALRAAIAEKTRVLVFSLEMSVEELAERALASLSGVNLSRLQGGELMRREAEKVAQAAAGVREAELVFDANPAAMVTDIAAAARRERPGLIVIDYLQLMTTGRNQENRQAEVSEISRGLKLLAREAEVPVVALSQLSRNLENRHDKRPQLFDLRDSGAIEQDADIVIFVHHDTPGFAEGTVVEVIVAKHRNGPLGTAKVWFEPAVMRFGDLAR